MTTYYGITYEDYSNLYEMVIACSFASLLPLIYLIFIRDYFSMVAFLPDAGSSTRDGYVFKGIKSNEE